MITFCQASFLSTLITIIIIYVCLTMCLCVCICVSVEYPSIYFSHQEEMRMKYLEEIQRAKEEKRMEAKRMEALDLMQRQKKVKEEKERVLARIRKGNFMYHTGTLGFYPDIRDEELPYIQYEDDDGTPYFFDSITLKTSYEIPFGAPVMHHTDKERIDYDKLYGQGAYDALMADRAFKEKCNQDGGYWDNGKWIALGGYYDENYEFVSLF
jgi:hypothetical protein